MSTASSIHCKNNLTSAWTLSSSNELAFKPNTKQSDGESVNMIHIVCCHIIIHYYTIRNYRHPSIIYQSINLSIYPSIILLPSAHPKSNVSNQMNNLIRWVSPHPVNLIISNPSTKPNSLFTNLQEPTYLILPVLPVLLLMEEILHHLGWLKPYKYWDNHYPWWCKDFVHQQYQSYVSKTTVLVNRLCRFHSHDTRDPELNHFFRLLRRVQPEPKKSPPNAATWMICSMCPPNLAALPFKRDQTRKTHVQLP